jgi:hypothetical protein
VPAWADQPVDGLGQGVVVAVALAADRGLDAGLGEPLRVANTDGLRPAIRVMDQGIVALGLPGVQGLLQSVEDCEAPCASSKTDRARTLGDSPRPIHDRRAGRHHGGTSVPQHSPRKPTRCLHARRLDR